MVTSAVAGTAPGTAGVIGQDGTEVLFGDQGVAGGFHPGVRIRLGLWLDPSECAGIEASYLTLGNRATGFAATSTTTPILARPYYDLQTGQQAAMLVAHPDFLTGSVNVHAASDWQTFEVGYRQALVRHCGQRVDWFLGYRFARLDDLLRVTHFSRYTAAQGQVVAGTTKDVLDSLDGETEFHGGEWGILAQDRCGRWTRELTLKLALGASLGRVDVSGRTTTTVPNGGTTAFDGGLLAQTTNIGVHEESGFAVLPELGVRVGYDLTPRLRATIGYDLVIWSRVLRAADQVDLSMSQLPPESPTGSQHPRFPAATSTFWAQGLQLGLEYVF